MSSRVRLLVLTWVILEGVVGSLIGFAPKAQAAGATLSFTPNQGEYLVDNTFDVSLVVNTGGQAINAVEAFITFPADKLQVVSPSVTNSFITVWVAGPSFSNTEGKLTFQGGLPTPGVNTTAGIISTVKFRARAAGKATLKYQDASKVLANDGSGTNILETKAQATFDIKLPTPAGPVVSSPTHEDSNRWYNNRTITFNWEPVSGSTEYSYILDTAPTTTPDEQADSTNTTLTQTVDSGGRWFFHIRAKNAAGWSGTTHFQVKIDSSPPAKFTAELEPKTPDSNTRGLLKFFTTDDLSGVDHYEVKIIQQTEEKNSTTAFFVEAHSPYQLPKLEPGRYIVIVRALDAAGNYTDSELKFQVVAAGAAGLTSRLLSGPLMIAGSLLLLLLLAFLIWTFRRRRRHLKVAKHLSNDLQVLQEEIQERQKSLQDLVSVQQASTQQLRGLTDPSSNPSTQGLNPGQVSPTQQL